MSIVLRDLLWKICLCYLDDTVIFAKTPEELIERLHQVSDRLRDVKLKVKPSKCVLFQEQIKFLGHKVSRNGVESLDDKIEAIQNWPRPHCVRDVRGVVALSVEYRTRDQEVVDSSLGRARGVKTVGMFLTPMCLYSPSSTSWYRPKGGDALRLGSKGRYGLCVGGR